MKIRNILACVALVALSACSSETSVDADEITVGVLVPYTGASANWNLEEALILASEQIAAGNGVGKRKVSLVFRNTRSDLIHGIAAAHELIDLHVTAVIGVGNDDLAEAIAPILSDSGVLFLTPDIGASTLNSRPDAPLWMRVGPSSRLLASKLAAKMVRQDKRQNIAIVSTSDLYGLGFSNALSEQIAASGGSVALLQQLHAGQSSYRAELAAVADSAPDAVVLCAPPAAASAFVNEQRSLGRTLPWYFCPVLESHEFVVNSWPDAIDGAIGVGAYVAPTDQQQFDPQFAARWGGNQAVSAVYFYFDALEFFAIAYGRARTTTKHDRPSGIELKDALYNISALDGGPLVSWNALPQTLVKLNNGTLDRVTWRGLTGFLLLSQETQAREQGDARFWIVHPAGCSENQNQEFCALSNGAQ